MRLALQTHKLLLLVILTTTLGLLWYTSCRITSNLSSSEQACAIVPTSESSHSGKQDQGKKIVLYWTQVFGREAVEQQQLRCTDNCVVTSNRCLASLSHYVIFHAYDLRTLEVLPPKTSSQQWIYYNLESPSNSDRRSLARIQEQIDGVMSYRLDSRIPIPYGRIVRRQSSQAVMPVPLKRKRVAWFVSNCVTASRREELVHKLSLFIQVDVYGACGSLECPVGDDSCNRMLERDYAFYLAFENSLCKDYVTEKLFRTLKYNVVPVVLAAPEVSSMLPKGSFIDARRFKSIPFLAKYLVRVASNLTLYNSFFEWKSDQEAHLTTKQELLCAPCFDNSTFASQSFQAVPPSSWVKWYFDDAVCA